MSGEYFDYLEYRIEDAAEEIDKLIAGNTADRHVKVLSDKTIAEFRRSSETARLLAVYLRRISYLVGGDDSEDTFHVRLKEGLESLPKDNLRSSAESALLVLQAVDPIALSRSPAAYEQWNVERDAAVIQLKKALGK